MEHEWRLDPIDRLLLSPRGQEIITKFFTTDDTEGPGQLDVAVAWAAILDELLQKTAATGRRVEQVVTEETLPRFWARRSPRKLRQRSVRQARQVTRLTGTPPCDPRFSTNYIETLGFAYWDDERIDSDIMALDMARIQGHGIVMNRGCDLRCRAGR